MCLSGFLSQLTLIPWYQTYVSFRLVNENFWQMSQGFIEIINENKDGGGRSKGEHAITNSFTMKQPSYASILYGETVNMVVNTNDVSALVLDDDHSIKHNY